MAVDKVVQEASAQALCALADIPDGGQTAVDAWLPDGEESLILMRAGEAVTAWLNVCPHAGRRLDYAPGRFLQKDDRVICAVHGATFERASGVCVAGPCCGSSLRRIAVRVADGRVWLA